MKTSILMTLLAGTIIVGCIRPSENVEKVKTAVAAPTEALPQVPEEYLADIETFRKETAEKIDANNLALAEFRVKIAGEKKKAKAMYTEQIAVLSQNNLDAKTKLDSYQAEGKDKWEIFKAEFSRDMNVLDEAFYNLTIKNVN